MYLQFTHKGNTRVAVEVYDDEQTTDGRPKLLIQKMLNRYNEKDVRWLATVANWELSETNQQLQDFCESGETDEKAGFEFEPNPELVESWTATNNGGNPSVPPEVSSFLLHVRELTQLRQHAKTFRSADPATALFEAFHDETPWKEALIEWTDGDQLTCLDVDYHTSTPPDADRLIQLVSSIRPQPLCWHPSHGGGAKLYYAAHPGYTAVDLASVAGMQWVQCDPRATFDLIKSTRHPLQARSRDDKPPPCSTPDDIHFLYGSGDVSSLKRLLTNEVDAADIEEYLASRGWNIGQTLPHSECPIDPDSSHKECVYVGDRGIFCHRCNARGLGGGSYPGLAGYSTLIGGTDSRLRNMVKHFVHLEHARIILENLYPNIPSGTLANIYRVMLKVVHNVDDPRINMAMYAGKGFVRINGQWVSADGNTSLAEGVAQYVRSLPVTLVPTKDGFSANVPITVSFLNSGDLSEYGYYDVSFIRGCRIYGQFLPYPHNENVKVIVRPEFNRAKPRYLPAARRMDEEAAWQLLESEFPGINRTYVKLLICAKGASEGRLAQCPFIMVTGVSSGGKSTTVHIAAGICGDKADEPIFYPDVLRFRGSLMDAARSSGFVCVNEIFKSANDAKMPAVNALNPMLSLTEDSRSHVLYVGSVPFGRLPVFVLTDINCPPEVTQDMQLARRFTFFRLHSSIQWTDTLVANNIRPHEFRCISNEHALAADTILSCIIDEHFREPAPLSTIVQRLGIANTVVSSGTQSDATDEPGERDDLKHSLRRFYKVVAEAPLLTGSDAQRYAPEKGWKKIDKRFMGAILDSWNGLADGSTGTEWTRSRAVDAEDWGRLLGLGFSVVCDIRNYQGMTLYVRFRSTENQKQPAWINGVEMPKKPKETKKSE